MICDGRKPVAIAGIMGGLNSEVKEDTSTVLLESAYFDPASIRRSSRWLGMSTDAAFRFERGIDPEGVVRALNRAAQLIAETSGGAICSGCIDQYPRKISAAENIPLRVRRVNAILGTKITAAGMIRILEGLEMKVTREDRQRCRVTPPTFRVDISREIDLIEEIARLHGYGHVPETLPAASVLPLEKDRKKILEERLRRVLNGCGYSEVITYSFIAPAAPDHLALEAGDDRRNLVKIRNPLTEEQSVMRTTLVYSLLETMRKNANAGCFDLKIFETGRIFLGGRPGTLPVEKNRVGGLLTGARYDDRWHFKEINADFYDIKGCVENLLDDLKLARVGFREDLREPFLHPGRCCGITAGDDVVGFLGEVHPDVLSRMDLKNRALVFEIDLDSLAGRFSEELSYRDISKFPSSSRDVAFLVSRERQAEDMIRFALDIHEELLEKVCIFDVYEGKGIPEGMRSLGLRFSYRAADRTLTDLEVSQVHGGIVKRILERSGARFRGEEN